MVAEIKEKPACLPIPMPLLRPLAIPTRGMPWWKRGWIWLSSKRQWEVMEDYILIYRGIHLLIRTGFIFDAASIPRIFWSVLDPTGLLLIPSMFHDHGYRFDYLWVLKEDGTREKWREGAGKAFWDDLFLHLSTMVNGVYFVAYVAYGCLWGAGWPAWWKNRKEL